MEPATNATSTLKATLFMISPKAPITAKDRGQAVLEGCTNNCTVKSSEEKREIGGKQSLKKKKKKAKGFKSHVR